jgi:DNA-binding transcriptional LysR family regulator
MPRTSTDDLAVFVAVGREGNFTRAAAKLGVSPSAVSQTMRALEERLGVRLVARTTRSVTLTTAGEQLLASMGPMLDAIDAELANLTKLRDKPAGTVRITADENAVNSVLWPALRKVLPEYPDMQVELIVDYGLTDIRVERGSEAISITKR